MVLRPRGQWSHSPAEIRRAPLVRSTLGLGLPRVLSGALLFIASVVIAREGGATALGIFGLASTVALYASSITDAGVSVFLVPGLGRLPRAEWSELWASALRFEIRSAIPFSAVYVLMILGLTTGGERLALLAALPWWLLLRFNLAARSVFTAAERVGSEARGTVVESVIGLVAVLITMTLTRSPALAVLGLTSGTFVGAVVRLRGLRALGMRGAAALGTARALARQTLPYGAGMTLQILYLRVDVLLVYVLAGARELGLYQPAVRFAAAAIIIPDALSSILLARTARDPDEATVKRRQQQLLAAGVLVGAAVVIVVAFAGRWLLGTVFGSEFRAASLALTLLAATPPITFIAAVNGNALTARGLQRERVVCVLVASFVAIGAGAPAIAIWGYNGAAVVSVINELVLTAAYAIALTARVGRHAVLVPAMAGPAAHSRGA